MAQTEVIKQVALHYEDHCNYQLTRLEQDSPIEYAITLRKLDQWIADSCVVADVGCGAGHYALHLARRKSQIHLIELSKSLLDATVEKFTCDKMSQNILSASLASATHLDFITSASVDAVILLGPLYHLITKKERQKALHEAHRILKLDGIIFASGINRLALLRDLWNGNRFPLIKERSQAINEIQFQLTNFIANGIGHADICPHLSPAYFTTAVEFQQECTQHFDPLEMIGVEAFTAHQQFEFSNKENHKQSAWLDLIEFASKTTEGIGASEHFLFIGKKRVS